MVNHGFFNERTPADCAGWVVQWLEVDDEHGPVLIQARFGAHGLTGHPVSGDAVELVAWHDERRFSDAVGVEQPEVVDYVAMLVGL